MNGGFLAGSIVSKLMLDTSKWTQSINQVKKDEKTMTGMGQRMSAGFKKAGMAMTVAGGAIVASLGGMIKKYVEAGDEIDKMRKRTGFAAETLSELRYAADISGTSLVEMEKGIKRMSKTIVDASEGMTTYQRAFDRINVNYIELKKLKPEDQFFAIAEAIAKVEDPTIRAASAQDIFGRAGTRLLPLFQEGPKGLKALKKEAHELGIVFDKEAAARAAKLKDAGTALKASLQGLGISLAEQLVPALIKVVQGITGVITKINDWAKAHPGLFNAITKIVAVLGGMMTVLGPILIILPKLVAGLAMLKTAFIALTGPIGLVTAGLAALAIGYMKVRDAQKKAEESARMAAEAEANLFKKLEKAALAAGMTKREFEDLKKAYDNNAAALGMAIKKGKEGKELQEALAKVGAEHKKVIDEQKKAYEMTIPAIEDYSAVMTMVADKMQTWTEYLKNIGIQTIAEKDKRVRELKSILEELHNAYRSGKIALEDYQKAAAAAEDELGQYEWNASAAARASRDLGDALEVGELHLKRTALATVTAEEKFIEFARTAGITTEELERRFYQLSMSMMRMAGFYIPQITLSNKAAWPQVREEVEKTEGTFTEVSQRIKDAWTMGLKDMLSGARSFKDVMGSIWGTIKEQFFTLVAQLISKWTLGFIGSILSGGKGLLDGIKNIFGGIGNVLTGSASGSGAGGLFGNLGSSFLGTISKMAGPIGIGLLVAKFINLKKVGESVTNALSSAFEGLGKVAASALDAVSNIISGIGRAIGGVLSAIGSLFGIGKKKISMGRLEDQMDYLISLNQMIYNLLHHIDWAQDWTRQYTMSTMQFQEMTKETLKGPIKWNLEQIRERLLQVSQRAYNRNSILGSIDTVLKELAKTNKGILNTLTKKGTAYVDVFRSAVIEKMKDEVSGGLVRVQKEIKGIDMSPIKGVAEAIRKIPAAQKGAVVSEPGLMMVHGTPSAPEIITPAPLLSQIVAERGKPVNINIKNIINLQGTILTDREYARQRLIPEIYKALDANAGHIKRRFKEYLGIQ